MVEEYLEELKNGNDLNDCVLDYYIDRKYSNTDELIRELEDLQRYGCVSGMIADLTTILLSFMITIRMI